MNPAIEVKNLSKKFKITREMNHSDGLLERLKIRGPTKEDIWALKDVNFKVDGSEWLGIIGENGSGKTTLLKILGNVMEPTEGNVKVRGKIASILGLGTGFKENLTAKENVYLYSSLMGLSRSEIKQKYEEIVSFSELYDYMNTKFKKFSDGMKMRLAFATAMNVDADIFLSDEVLSVGDGEFQKKCLEKMEEFKERQKTIVFVSHSLKSIKRWCDRVIFLDEGKVKSKGDVNEVINEYKKFLAWKGKNEEFKKFKDQISNDNIINNLSLYNEEGKESYIFPKCGYLRGIISFESEFEKVKINFIDKNTDRKRLTVFSKDIKKDENTKSNKLNFEIESLWLDEGKYIVNIEADQEKLYDFEIEVYGQESEKPDFIVFKAPKNKYEFPNGQFYIFGNVNNILGKFYNGKSIPVYKDIDIEELRNKFEDGRIINGD